MSKEQSTELPLWVQDRSKVIASEASVEWRSGVPDYSYTNQFLEKQRKHNHAEGSLNAIAHNLVKAFEMEATHKINPQQWISIVTDKFRMSTNGGPEYTAQQIVDAGTYNLFLGETEHYSSSQETIEIVGLSVARVSEDLKIESVEHFFDNSAFLNKLTAGGCPFHT